MAAKQRVAAKAVAKAEERLTRVQERVANTDTTTINTTATLAQCDAGRPRQVAVSLEQVEQAREVAGQEHHRLAAQREHVTKSIRAISHAYHFVDVERGVRRNGTLIADDIAKEIETIRTIAQDEGLSQACLDRIEKAGSSHRTKLRLTFSRTACL